MTAGAEDDGGRLRERALRAAATAYSAAHGHPLEHPTSSTVRWRTGTLAVVAGAVVLACLVGLVGLRAVVRPAPEPTLAPSVEGVGDLGRAGLAGTTGAAGEGGRGPTAGTGDVEGAESAEGEGTASPGEAARAVPAADDAGQLVVHVVGAVEAPGLVRLPSGARVADAVELAGGPTAAADLAGLNLARPVTDGEQIRVPLPGEEVVEPVQVVDGPGGGAVGPGSHGQGLTDVNRATASELEALPGIGPVLARRVVDHRTEHGPFTSVDALTAVSGIGPRVLEGLRDHVVVGPA